MPGPAQVPPGQAPPPSGEPPRTRPGELAAMVLLGVPVLGVLMGGVYALPVILATGGREPAVTLGLGTCLTAEVVLLGALLGLPPAYTAAVLATAGLALGAARALFGTLGHSLERFGMVHVVALLALSVAFALTTPDRATAPPAPDSPLRTDDPRDPPAR